MRVYKRHAKRLCEREVFRDFIYSTSYSYCIKRHTRYVIPKASIENPCDLLSARFHDFFIGKSCNNLGKKSQFSSQISRSNTFSFLLCLDFIELISIMMMKKMMKNKQFVSESIVAAVIYATNNDNLISISMDINRIV